MLLPGPPSRRSRPGPPNSTSSPAPPDNVSLPAPPIRTSFPPPPFAVNGKPAPRPDPWMTSSPANPLITRRSLAVSKPTMFTCAASPFDQGGVFSRLEAPDFSLRSQPQNADPAAIAADNRDHVVATGCID